MRRQISGPGFTLRPPQAGDADAAFRRWAADAQVLRWLGWRPHGHADQTRQQLAWDEARWLKKSAYTWMLLPAGERQPVGLVQLLPQQLDGRAHHLRLGFVLARGWQGRGLMRAAVACVGEQAFAEAPELWRIDALCDVDNQASARLLQAAGYACEGRLARMLMHPNVSDTPRDVWLYARWREGPPPAAPVAAVDDRPAGDQAMGESAAAPLPDSASAR